MKTKAEIMSFAAGLSMEDLEVVATIVNLELSSRKALAKAARAATKAKAAAGKAAKDHAHNIHDAKEMLKRGLPLAEACHQFNVTEKEIMP